MRQIVKIIFPFFIVLMFLVDSDYIALWAAENSVPLTAEAATVEEMTESSTEELSTEEETTESPTEESSTEEETTESPTEESSTEEETTESPTEESSTEEESTESPTEESSTEEETKESPTEESSTEEETTESEVIPNVVDLDLGDYEKIMFVDENQMLSPTAIFDVSDALVEATYSYKSSDTTIATVNALGRVKAIAEGEVRIFISCNGLTKFIDITVKVNKVMDLDIEEHDDSLEVGKTLSLNVTTIPSDIDDAKIVFQSSNTEIATVNANGRVTGIKPGEVDIIISSGDIVRKVHLTVKIKTEGITIEDPHIILKPGGEHIIRAIVTPSTAPQSLTYTSFDKNIVTVSSSGKIQAIGSGSTSVLVSNGDQKAVVFVIVNENVELIESTSTHLGSDIIEDTGLFLQLTEEIIVGEEGKIFYAEGKELPIVPTEVLIALYGSQKTLIIDCDGYKITIVGNSIKNTENELSTEIKFESKEKGLEFVLNDKKNLPGTISIVLDPQQDNYQWLYLYNESLQKWQLLNSFENGIITIDTAGRYVLTIEKMSLWGLNWQIIGNGFLCVIGLAGAYILIKKKYWFW